MVRTLICEAGSGDGGSTAYLYSFLRHLDNTKFHPIVLFTHKAQGYFVARISELVREINFMSDKENHVSFSYSSIRYIKYIQILFRLIQVNLLPIVRIIILIKKRNIDLVILNQDVVFHLPATLAAAITHTPCIVRKGGVGTYKGKRLWKFLARFPYAHVASSHAEYRFHVDSGFPYKRMNVIFEGVDIDEFRPGKQNECIRSEFGIGPSSPVIGSISRIVDGKGHEDLIAAASLVLKEYPRAFFFVVGDGDRKYIRDLQDQVRSLGIQDKVVFTGWRKDTAQVLKSIDIFVHCPNRWLEGMGIATLEALANGKPVVITDNWGLSDTTQDGYNGFVVPIGDKEKIAEKILVLLKDKELRKQMGMNSRKRALELFDLHKNIKEIEKIMHEASHS